MKSAAPRESSRTAAAGAASRASESEDAVALAPPAYGIDFVDGAMQAAAPVRRVGKLEEHDEEEALQRRFDAGALAQAKAEPFVLSNGGIVQRTKWFWDGTQWRVTKGSKPPFSPKPDWTGDWHETVDTGNAEETGNQKKKTKGKADKEEKPSAVDPIKAAKDKAKAKREAEKETKAEEGGVYGRLLALKKSNEHKFIRGLLGAFDVDGWHFPAQSAGDGIMGKNTISASRTVAVGKAEAKAKADHKLALHINFMIGAASFTEGSAAISARLNLALLHVTARSADSQVQIVEDGPSILTAAKSIHCGPSNDWDWNDENVGELLTEIGGGLEALKAAVGKFGMDYIAALRADLKTEMTRAANAQGVTLTFEGDKTWT